MGLYERCYSGLLQAGKPTDNAYIESFNGKFSTECLNQYWFMTLDDACQKIENWRVDYNEVRPHNAIGNNPPISLVNGSGASNAPKAKTPENTAENVPF